MFTTRVSVTIPKRTNDGEAHPEVTTEVLARFARAFGGSTAQEARGFWVNEAGVLVADDSTIVYSYTDDKARATELVEDTALYVKRALAQDAVLYAIEDARAGLC